MYNPNSGFPMRNRGMFGASGYRYETLPYAQEGAQEGGLISKVMGLLSASFLFAFIGTLLGMFVIHLNYGGGYWIVAIVGIENQRLPVGLYSILIHMLGAVRISNAQV